MRALASALLVLTVGLMACDNEGLVVRVEGLSPDITALRVRFLRDGQPVGQDREITHTLQQFVVTGVEGGDYQLDIAGLGSDRCIVARQSQSVSYRGGSLRPTDVSVRLSPDPNKPCPIRITVEDGVFVSSTPKGIACGKDAQGQSRRDCVIDIPRGTRVELRGQTTEGFTTYPSFSGLCFSVDECAFDVSRSGEIKVASAQRICNADNWCVQNPLPQNHRLNDLWGFSSADIWAVGSQGTVLHYDGTSWKAMDVPIQTNLVSVWGPSPGDIWAVGSGTDNAIHYTRGKWEVVRFKTQYLNVIHGSGADNFWVLGADGFAAHNDGMKWTESVIATYGSPRSARALWSSQDGSAWSIDDNGQVSLFKKDTWTSILQKLDIGAGFSITSADNNYWVVGSGGIAHTTGQSKWTQDILPAPAPGDYYSFSDIWAANMNDVWAVGSSRYRGLLLHWNGQEWKVFDSPSQWGLVAVWGSSPTDVWAVGDVGSMIHWDGVGWQQYSKDAAAGQTLKKSWGADAHDIWTVGSQGTITHWDGNRWTLNTTKKYGNLTGIWGSKSDNIWAVGDAGLSLHYQAGVWTLGSIIGPENIAAIWLASDGNGFAVGGTKIFSLQNGTWKSALQSMRSLYNVWGSSPNSIWATGYQNCYRYIGGSWNEIMASDGINSVWEIPGGVPLATIDDSSSYNPLRRFNGSWNSEPFPSQLTPAGLRSIWGRGQGDMVVLGRLNKTEGIAQYNNGMWRTTALSDYDLQNVWGTGDGHMWAVGAFGVILHQAPPASAPGPRP